MKSALALLAVISVYFFPLWIAMARECKARAGIAILNLFLGWTFVGWVVALTWASVGEKDTHPGRLEVPRGTGSRTV